MAGGDVPSDLADPSGTAREKSRPRHRERKTDREREGKKRGPCEDGATR